MIQVSAVKYANAAEMVRSYTARRKRLMGAFGKRIPVPKIVSISVPPAVKVPPLWEIEDTYFDAHVDTWMVRAVKKVSPLQYLKSRARDLGFTYEAIIGTSQLRKIVRARQTIMWELRKKYPTLSFPQIGRICGRDHTTVMYAISKIQKEKIKGKEAIA